MRYFGVPWSGQVSDVTYVPVVVIIYIRVYMANIYYVNGVLDVTIIQSTVISVVGIMVVDIDGNFYYSVRHAFNPYVVVNIANVMPEV